MGVKGLWPVVASAAEQHNLMDLALREGFQGAKGVRAYQLGIDISIWFEEIQQVKAFRPTAASGQNTVLQLFFWRLVHLLSLPVVVFFVFEGDEKAEFKRDKHVLTSAHWMTNAAQYMIEACGFEYSMAPGEAEAELAAMNRADHIDAVVTNDIDTFLFGGLTVIRTWNKADKNTITTYNTTHIEKDIDATMNRDGVILFGLLSGADYSKGLRGCGSHTALGVVKYGLGTSLCDAARTMSCDKFRHFLIAWRDRLREVLRMDPQGLIGRRNPACAENVTDTFPDPDIVHSYLNPLTSLSHGQTLPSVNGRIPDLARLGELCERYFEWATPAGILPKFHKHVWSGVVLRMIREDILNTDALPDTANCLAQITGHPLRATDTSTPNVIRTRTVEGIPECKVRFPVANFAAATLSKLHEPLHAENDHAGCSKGKERQRDIGPSTDIPAHVDVWLPLVIFRTWTVGGMSAVLMMEEGDDDWMATADLITHRVTSAIGASSTIDLTITPDEAPSNCSSHFMDGVTIDLSSANKIIYDLTDL